jgi:hypothetical protein
MKEEKEHICGTKESFKVSMKWDAADTIDEFDLILSREKTYRTYRDCKEEQGIQKEANEARDDKKLVPQS